MTERELSRERFTADELRALLAGRPAADIFSWKSPTARKLGLGTQQSTLSDEDLIRLMAGEPNLIRRPLLTVGGEIIPGFDKAARTRLSELLGKTV